MTKIYVDLKTPDNLDSINTEPQNMVSWIDAKASSKIMIIFFSNTDMLGKVLRTEISSEYRIVSTISIY